MLRLLGPLGERALWGDGERLHLVGPAGALRTFDGFAVVASCADPPRLALFDTWRTLSLLDPTTGQAQRSLVNEAGGLAGFGAEGDVYFFSREQQLMCWKDDGSRGVFRPEAFTVTLPFGNATLAWSAEDAAVGFGVFGANGEERYRRVGFTLVSIVTAPLRNTFVAIVQDALGRRIPSFYDVGKQQETRLWLKRGRQGIGDTLFANRTLTSACLFDDAGVVTLATQRRSVLGRCPAPFGPPVAADLDEGLLLLPAANGLELRRIDGELRGVVEEADGPACFTHGKAVVLRGGVVHVVGEGDLPGASGLRALAPTSAGLVAVDGEGRLHRIEVD